jgi:RNA polymerase sigma-70 factor (ECF subfamily)
MNQHSFGPIKNGDEVAFEKVFREFYPYLVNFANGILKDKPLAEEQAQEVFANLWEKRLALKDDLRLLPYLLTSVKNKCINIINKRLVENKYMSETQRDYQNIFLNYSHHEVSDDLIKQLHETLNKLPPKCREVFELSRFEELSHRAIGEKLGISSKTIENHISKALRILKENLRNGKKSPILAIGALLS